MKKLSKRLISTMALVSVFVVFAMASFAIHTGEMDITASETALDAKTGGVQYPLQFGKDNLTTVGDLYVKKVANGEAIVTFDVTAANYYLNQVHLGLFNVPEANLPDIVPGQLDFNSGKLSNVTTYSVYVYYPTDVDAPTFVAAHGVVVDKNGYTVGNVIAYSGEKEADGVTLKDKVFPSLVPAQMSYADHPKWQSDFIPPFGGSGAQPIWRYVYSDGINDRGDEGEVGIHKPELSINGEQVNFIRELPYNADREAVLVRVNADNGFLVHVNLPDQEVEATAQMLLKNGWQPYAPLALSSFSLTDFKAANVPTNDWKLGPKSDKFERIINFTPYDINTLYFNVVNEYFNTDDDNNMEGNWFRNVAGLIYEVREIQYGAETIWGNGGVIPTRAKGTDKLFPFPVE